MNDEKGNYEILKEMSDFSPAISVRIVKGRSNAEMTVDRLNRNRSEVEIRAAWSYFLKPTTTKAPSTREAPSAKKGRRGRKNDRWAGR